MPRRLTIAATMLMLLGALVATPAQAATTTFRISPLGVFTSPATANITGNATCEGGTGTLTFTNHPDMPYVIAGETGVVCDGQQHSWAATVTSPTASFKRGGTYLIVGTLTSPGGTAGPATFKVTLL